MLLPRSAIRRARSSVAILTLLATVSPSALAQKSGQELRQDRVVDHDYRFTLTAPYGSWVMMGEEEATQITPGAIAGMRSRNNPRAYATVIAEPAFGTEMTVEQWAGLAYDNVGLDDKELLESEPSKLDEHDAWRTLFRGVLNGATFRFQIVVVLRDDFVFQLIQWGLDSHVSGSSIFTRMLRSLTFDRGKIRVRDTADTQSDSHGVGWRTRDGVFESAVHGYRLRLPNGWRGIYGEELDQTNPDAEVGLTSAQLNAFAVLITEPAHDDADRLAAQTRINLKESLGIPPTGEVAFEVLGSRRTFDEYPASGDQPFAFLHSAWIRDGSCYQVLAWCAPRARDRVVAELPAVLAGFEALSEREHRQLTQELAALPDLQNQVGPDFSLRDGIFRDFAYAYRWRRPTAGFWEVQTGTAGHQHNMDARLFATELESGLSMALIPEYRGGLTAEEYHRVITSFAGEGFDDRTEGETFERTVDGVEQRHTTVRAKMGKLSFRFSINTFARGDLAVQCTLSGTEAAFSNRIVERSALDGLELLAALEPTRSTRKAYEDHRLGFRLTLPPGVRAIEDNNLDTQNAATTLTLHGTDADASVLACARRS